MKRTRCTSDNRDMILHVLQTETGQEARYHPSPAFTVSIGEYTLRRDGLLEADEDILGIFGILAELDLCDHPLPQQKHGNKLKEELVCPSVSHDG